MFKFLSSASPKPPAEMRGNLNKTIARCRMLKDFQTAHTIQRPFASCHLGSTQEL
jgi:hypothetical protein